jgi:hypothetical protein
MFILLVCSALGSNIFEEMSKVKRLSIEGPLNGSNTEFTFEIALTVHNKTRGTSFAVNCLLSSRQKQMILAGGALNIRTQQ